MSKTASHQKPRPYLAVLLLGIGMILGWILYLLTHQTPDTAPLDVIAIHPADNAFHFTNPLLGFEVTDQKELDEFKPLEQTINQKVSVLNQDGQQHLVSVYVRDLNSGRWTGVNEDETFTPASLMKVPVMLTYLKQTETNPNFLSTKFTITQDDLDTSPQDIPPTQGAKLGESYAISDLLKFMIVYSDNVSLKSLFNHIDPKTLVELFQTIGINPPEVGTNFVISPKNYSFFFRLLYNATYLSPTESEFALNLLSQSDFQSGLSKNIPKDIPIAHKFGEAAVQINGTNSYELHDCGIVYVPQHPYFLCIMTRGTDKNQLEDNISQLSETIFDAMKNP